MRVKGRFRVLPGALAAATVTLSPQEARHASVRRLQIGDQVQLLDGAGESALAQVRSLQAGCCELEILQRQSGLGESPLRLCLVQALPVKLGRMDTVVREATELGVRHIVPVLSEHGQLPGGGLDSVLRRLERWKRVAETASKQCGRSVVPELGAVVGLAELDWDALPAPLLLLHPGADAGAAGRLLAGEPEAQATVLVGPEGGFSAEERQCAARAGALEIGLGPRILRAETAGAVALALLQGAWGDLGVAGD